jgi:hypothetical protein
MCGRYGRRADKQRIAEWFHTHNTDVFNDEHYEINNTRIAPSYNISPENIQPIVRLDRDTGERVLTLMRWGLVPYWSKAPKANFSSINARSEQGVWQQRLEFPPALTRYLQGHAFNGTSCRSVDPDATRREKPFTSNPLSERLTSCAARVGMGQSVVGQPWKDFSGERFLAHRLDWDGHLDRSWERQLRHFSQRSLPSEWRSQHSSTGRKNCQCSRGGATHKGRRHWRERPHRYNESLTGIRRWPSRDGSVENGIDVLEEENFAVLAWDTSVKVHGRALTTLFNPGHVIVGARDIMDIFKQQRSRYWPASRQPVRRGRRPLRRVAPSCSDEGIATRGLPRFHFSTLDQSFAEPAKSGRSDVVSRLWHD